EPFEMFFPFVGLRDWLRDEVVDRRSAGARRQLAGDLPGRRGTARSSAGDLEDAGAQLTEHAGKRPALVVIAHAGGVAATLRRGGKAERAGMHRLADQLFHPG